MVLFWPTEAPVSEKKAYEPINLKGKRCMSEMSKMQVLSLNNASN